MGGAWGPLPYHHNLVITRDACSKTNLPAEIWGEMLGPATDRDGHTAGVGETGAEEERHRSTGAPTVQPGPEQHGAERTP